MLKVLFLCTYNACRSQMAEGLVNHDLAGQVQAFAAGCGPAESTPGRSRLWSSWASISATIGPVEKAKIFPTYYKGLLRQVACYPAISLSTPIFVS